jgi:chemotaxis protein MotB
MVPRRGISPALSLSADTETLTQKAADRMAKKGDKGITIIRREEIIAGGHHGGAWKVAYADFVTAMMAFFLLMWLLNATTEAQRRGLADYFSPTIATARGTSGSGRPFGGKSPFEDGPALSDRGTLVTMNANAPPVDVEDDGSDTPVVRSVHSTASDATGTDTGGHTAASGNEASAAAAREAARRVQQVEFKSAAVAMQQAVAGDPALAGFAHQLSIDVTPQGLRVQIRDADKKPMFDTGLVEPNAQAHALLLRLLPILMKLPEPISIAGYTDAAPYSGVGRSNWDLSTERANATRKVLTDAGLPDGRIRDVAGHADRDLLLPADPLAAANRRVAIVLLRR